MFKELFEVKKDMTLKELNKIHSGVKYSWNVEILNKFLNNKEFRAIATSAGAFKDDSVMKRVITNILTSIKSVRRKDNRIISINYDFDGIKIKHSITLTNKEYEDNIKTKLSEATDDEVYFTGKTLWVAYGQGSGTTAYNLDITRYLNSDKTDAGHYDDIVPKLAKFAKNNKPLKSKSNVKLFEIPVYEESKYTEFGKSLDIWGGTQTPQDKYYMVITDEKSTIVNFFRKKKEALSWLRVINV